MHVAGKSASKITVHKHPQIVGRDMIRCNLQIRVSAGKFSAAIDHDFGLPLCNVHFTEDRVLHVGIHPNTTRSLLKLDLRKDVVLKNERTIENRPEDLTRHYAIEGSGSVGI